MDSRFALSRNEEEKLLKQMKVDALKNCSVTVNDFAECGAGRTISVVWSCSKQFKAMKACMATQMTPERIDEEKVKFLKGR